MKVTLEQLAEKIDAMNSRLDKLEETMNKGKGAITFIAWLGGIVAIVGGYFISE